MNIGCPNVHHAGIMSPESNNQIDGRALCAQLSDQEVSDADYAEARDNAVGLMELLMLLDSPPEAADGDSPSLTGELEPTCSEVHHGPAPRSDEVPQARPDRHTDRCEEEALHEMEG